MKLLDDKTVIKCEVFAQKEMSFDDLFEKISDYQKSFFTQMRVQVEVVLLKTWRTCSGARNGEVQYEDVKTACLSAFGETEHYDIVIVDYYLGTIAGYGSRNKSAKLFSNLSVVNRKDGI